MENVISGQPSVSKEVPPTTAPQIPTNEEASKAEEIPKKSREDRFN